MNGDSTVTCVDNNQDEKSLTKNGKKKFLFCAFDSIGHVNCALSFASLFAPRGHEIYFFTNGYGTKLVTEAGYENVIIPAENGPNEVTDKKPEITPAQMIGQAASFFRMSRLDNLVIYGPNGPCYKLIESHKMHEKLILKAIEMVKPDILIGDYVLPIPALFKLDIPWIPLYSLNPLPVFYKNGPPRGSGYSVNGPKQLWDEFKAREAIEKKHFRDEMSEWLGEHGLTIDRPHSTVWVPKFMGVYVYPKALDYVDQVGPCADNWFRIDPVMRPFFFNPLQLPDNLLNKPGSLIYLSFGTLGSCDVQLMKRITDLLASCPHRFIVSKGPQADCYSLPDNMWGDAFLDQLSILQQVDLVITHGGNNTFGECLYFGKPMIIMPLFADQYDNAQRLEDLNLGRRFNPFTVEKDHLISAINEMLSDENLKKRLNEIKDTLVNSDSHQKVVQLVEKIIEEKKCPFN